jgi:hypothetical protein
MELYGISLTCRKRSFHVIYDFRDKNVLRLSKCGSEDEYSELCCLTGIFL